MRTTSRMLEYQVKVLNSFYKKEAKSVGIFSLIYENDRVQLVIVEKEHGGVQSVSPFCKKGELHDILSTMINVCTYMKKGE